MRIALVAPPWYAIPPEGYGGIEWVVALLADGLTDRGHDVTLYAPPGSQTKARLVSPLPQAPSPETVGNPWWEASHALDAYDEVEGFDLLHDHMGPVGVAIGALSAAQTVHTLHGPFVEETSMLYRRVARHHWFVAISERQRSQAPPGLRWAGVVYNGIPVDRYPYRQDKDDYLLFMGRVDDEKAPDLAVEAANRAGRRLVMCVTTKNERERRYWAEKVEPLLSDRVDVRGECGHEEKAELLAGAAALLFPVQWEEPFGLVMPEAMACGTPVVAWRNGAVPEVVEDGVTGFVVDSMDDFVRAIDRVGELDPRACRDVVERRFSGDAMVEGYLEAYRRALAGEDG